MKLLVASDHAGFELKQALQAALPNLEWVDLGPTSLDRVDYPDFAKLLTEALLKDPSARGVLICGSGIGMSIAANRKRGIRAALCFEPEHARLARSHNDANILCLGARLTSTEAAIGILNVFLQTSFEGGRHADRVRKIDVKE